MTVGALRHGRIFFMCGDLDAFERTEVLIAAVMLALIYRTFNAHICFAIVHVQKPALLQNNSEAKASLLFCAFIQILCISINDAVCPVFNYSGHNRV